MYSIYLSIYLSLCTRTRRIAFERNYVSGVQTLAMRSKNTLLLAALATPSNAASRPPASRGEANYTRNRTDVSAPASSRKLKSEDPPVSKLEAPDGAKLMEFHRVTSPLATAGLVSPGLTMISPSHIAFEQKAVKKLNGNPYVAGDIVECGVWRGGSMVALILAQIQTSTRARILDRNFWLFDTFEGLPPPTAEDGERVKTTWNSVHSDAHNFREDKGGLTRMSNGQVKWNYGSIDMVRAALGLTGYPSNQINFVRGKVEDTLADPAVKAVLPERIALLRLDTDWYKSTRAELDVLFDRIVPGGFLIIDDYCTWGGSRRAADEFFKNRSMVANPKVGPCLVYEKPAQRAD